MVHQAWPQGHAWVWALLLPALSRNSLPRRMKPGKKRFATDFQGEFASWNAPCISSHHKSCCFRSGGGGSPQSQGTSSQGWLCSFSPVPRITHSTLKRSWSKTRSRPYPLGSMNCLFTGFVRFQGKSNTPSKFRPDLPGVETWLLTLSSFGSFETQAAQL